MFFYLIFKKHITFDELMSAPSNFMAYNKE